MNLFERKTEICYCVPNGASACAPCRERLAKKNAETPVFSPAEFSYKEAKPVIYDHIRDGMIFDGKFIPETVLNELAPGSRCPNCCAPLETYHVLDGCSCHLNPPCSYCCENSLICPNCDFLLELPDA